MILLGEGRLWKSIECALINVDFERVIFHSLRYGESIGLFQKYFLNFKPLKVCLAPPNFERLATCP